MFCVPLAVPYRAYCHNIFRSDNRYEAHYYYKYNEKEVVHRAWDKYGGPDGLWDV